MAEVTHKNTSIAESEMAEARAGLQAITTVADLGFRHLILEGDCLTVKKNINDKKPNRSSISVIIQEIKQRSLGFKSFTCSFVGRTANQAVHAMADEGKKIESDGMDKGGP